MPAPKSPNLDSLTSINEDGSRHFIHPADVSGRFTLWRRVFGWLLLAVYILLPWIPVGGHPAVFLDLAERRFHFFGLTFLSEDLWIGFFLLTGLGFSLFYLTALFGRLWCGWACPYTVFLELLYRRVERWIDGDATKRRRLASQPLDGQRIARLVAKHGIYLLISLAIAHLFLAYFISIPRLYGYMQDSPTENLKSFGVMLFLTGSLYFSFAWFREQFCIILCPYGRLQSALTDEDTVVIGYDERRGEPRGKASDPAAGDCVACNRCVQVCPTGIDIRDGLQLECIGCAACIDACDDIMEKVGRPRGLVRYDSLKGLAGEKRRIWRPRIVLYTGLLLLGLAVLGGFLTTLHSAKVEVFRLAGNPFYLDEVGVRNHYRLRLVTKRSEETVFRLRFDGLPDGAVISGVEETVVLQPGEETLKTLVVQVPTSAYRGGFQFTVEAEISPGEFTVEDRITFLGPSAYILNRPEP